MPENQSIDEPQRPDRMAKACLSGSPSIQPRSISCPRPMGASNSSAPWCKSSWPASITGWRAICDRSSGTTQVLSVTMAGWTSASTLVTKTDDDPRCRGHVCSSPATILLRRSVSVHAQDSSVGVRRAEDTPRTGAVRSAPWARQRRTPGRQPLGAVGALVISD
jgi:hypothetical protein